MPSAVILAAAVALTAVLAEERTTCVAGNCAVADRADRVRGALFGTFVADALSMPVHWYYDTRQLAADYGFVTDYLAPQARHAGSIMGKSSTGGHGRGGQSGDIIGRVINHGKRDLWLRPSVHYHVGMRAGENTLNAGVARVAMGSVVDLYAAGGDVAQFDPAVFLDRYGVFVTVVRLEPAALFALN